MIYLDFDGVIADLHTEWYRRFNERVICDPAGFVDFSKATSWDVSNIVPEGLKTQFYAILHDPDLYHDVKPVPGALDAIQWLDDQRIEWAIATACHGSNMITGKIRWMNFYGIARGHEGTMPLNLIPIRHKHLLRGDMLVDDGPHNLEKFEGVKVLFDVPYNRNDHRFIRAYGWDGVKTIINDNRRHLTRG